MKLYVDLSSDRHYLVTDDGEAVYVDELEDQGRDTEILEQTIDAEESRPRSHKATLGARSVTLETQGTE